MSIENARAFYRKVRLDQVIQQQVIESAKAQPGEIESVIIQMGGENGFEFTLQEMRTFMAELSPVSGELSDNQLEAVAGGAKSDWISMSIGTVGFGCLISGVQKGVDNSCPLDK